MSIFDYDTLSVKAYGFEITDKDGNTVTDRYVRTLSDFNSGDYGMVYRNGKRTGSIAGCSYLENFTFRFTGSENTTGWGVIEFTLKSRDGSSAMGDSVTVYYTLQNGVLKLTDKSPVRGDQNGGDAAVLVPEDETVTPTQENINVSFRMENRVLYPSQYLGDFIELQARVAPHGTFYPTEDFTAELVYAESLREKDFSFTAKQPPMPLEPNASGMVTITILRVPADAPVGAYDLRIREPATGFEWTYENVVTVIPDESGAPAYEDLICTATTLEDTLRQGENVQHAIIITLWEDGVDQNFFCSAVLVYAEDGGEGCTITVKDSPFSSIASPTYIPADVPVGGYDLIVTDSRYGYTWRFNHFIEVIPNPDAQKYGFFTDIDIVDPLTVSRSSDETYTFSGGVENRGLPFTMTVTPQSRFVPTATLVYADAPADSGEVYEIPLRAVTGPAFEPYELTVPTGTASSQIFEIMVTPDTPLGAYDLILSYKDVSTRIYGAVEVTD
ncbi:MAG: hypothetical protein IJ363_03340 [Clostridia bacterium]|nr:hypothetical protein [Clostridia bacterium]